MKYVQPIGAAGNAPYVDANPMAGIEGSPVPAAAIEHPMRELVALISDVGLTPDDSDLGQVVKAIKILAQKASSFSASASGTPDAITANFTPAITALSDHMFLIVRAAGANTIAAPTFTPSSASIPALTIVKGHNQPLVVGDISGAGFRAELQFDAALNKWVLLNPATGVGGADPNIAKLNVKQTWSAQQTPKSGILADAANISWDGDINGQVVELVLGGNRMLSAPSNIQKNSLYILRVTQDAVGGRALIWNTAYKFGGSGAPTLTATPSKTDILSFIGGVGNTLEFVGARTNAV